jgi:hypothetical protein
MRTMMVVVAIVAVTSLVGRETWTWWLTRGRITAVYPSQLSASASSQGIELTWAEGQSIPVAITYNLMFGTQKPPQGTTCLLIAEVWFEDVATGRAVDRYTFDAPLTVDGRETASGSLTWNALLPHPGRFMLRYMLHCVGRAGELHLVNGGSRGYTFVANSPTGQTPIHSGPQP